MTPSGDMTFGSGAANFLVNTPAAVRQAMITRLALWTGQWFLDGTAGTPWATLVLGKNPKVVYDTVITNRIQGTPGFLSIADYSSNLDASTRHLTFNATVNTLYGQTGISSAALNPPLGPSGLLVDELNAILRDEVGNELFDP